MFLVNWAPHRRLIRMYERIAKADVRFQEVEHEAEAGGPWPTARGRWCVCTGDTNEVWARLTPLDSRLQQPTR